MNIAQGLNLNNQITGGIDTCACHFNFTVIPANTSAITYLWVQEEYGIVSGQTYTFTTAFNLAAITFMILISFTGTVGSMLM